MKNNSITYDSSSKIITKSCKINKILSDDVISKMNNEFHLFIYLLMTDSGEVTLSYGQLGEILNQDPRNVRNHTEKLLEQEVITVEEGRGHTKNIKLKQPYLDVALTDEITVTNVLPDYDPQILEAVDGITSVQGLSGNPFFKYMLKGIFE